MREAYHHPQRRGSIEALKSKPEKETSRKPKSNKEGKKVRKPAQTVPTVDELSEPSKLPQPKSEGGVLDSVDSGPPEAQALPRPTAKVQKVLKKASLLTARPSVSRDSETSAADDATTYSV